jgi:hypothetical protein
LLGKNWAEAEVLKADFVGRASALVRLALGGVVGRLGLWIVGRPALDLF